MKRLKMLLVGVFLCLGLAGVIGGRSVFAASSSELWGNDRNAINVRIAGISYDTKFAAVVEGTVNTDCSKSIMGIRPWYHGLTVGDNCVIGKPTDDTMPAFVWTIILNILTNLLAFSGVLVIFYIIYAGFTYITSTGEPAKIAKAKNTIINAVIGLGLILVSHLVVNLIIGVIGG